MIPVAEDTAATTSPSAWKTSHVLGALPPTVYVSTASAYVRPSPRISIAGKNGSVATETLSLTVVRHHKRTNDIALGFGELQLRRVVSASVSGEQWVSF